MEIAPLGHCFAQSPQATHFRGVGSPSFTNMYPRKHSATQMRHPTQVFLSRRTTPFAEAMSDIIAHMPLQSPHWSQTAIV